MIPELFRIGPFSITPFGPALVAALLLASMQLRWGLRRMGSSRGRAADDAAALLVAAAFGGIVGGKAYYALLQGDWRLLASRAGLVWYGGFLVGTAAVLLVMRQRQMPLWRSADATAPALALGYGVGRIGCLLVGDDYGKYTELPWGIEFPKGLPPTVPEKLTQLQLDELGVPPGLAPDVAFAVHPTQIYETVAALLICWFGRSLLARGTAPGGVALPVVALLSVERFLVEFLRAKDDRFFGGLTLAQLIAAAILLLVAWLWLRRRRAS